MDTARINLILQKDCQLNKANPVIVGVSGGPDSLCLLDLLVSLGYPVVVAHFNHHLRPEAGDEASRVENYAREHGLAFEPGDLDVAALARKDRLSVEEAARKSRYRFLFACARSHQAQAVAVGHTADDQVETVLMHLLRGSGLAGLRGMDIRAVLPEWDPVIPLVRPLLDTWRSETLAYCAGRGLEPVFDPSNADTAYFRNRLRHDLLPILETYNPRIKAALLRMSHSLAGDYQLILQETRRAMAETVVSEGEGYLGLDFRKLSGYPAGLQRSIFRQAIASLRPALRNIDFEDIERALDFLGNTPRTGQTDLTSGLRLFVEGGCLYLAGWETTVPHRTAPQIDRGCVYRLDAHGRITLPGGWTLETEPVHSGQANPDRAGLPGDPYQAWLDAAKLFFPLEIRGRQPGDRFYPFGMDGHSLKLADYFINVKLPRGLRDGWPLICSQAEIAWIPGYRPAHPFALDPSTRQAVHLRLYLDPTAVMENETDRRS